MSELVITHAAEAPAAVAPGPLDEAAWQAWLAKGRADDLRSRAARITALLWSAAALLLAVALFWRRA